MSITLYIAPLRRRMIVGAWPQESQYYRGGFVLRVLWLGLAIRWGHRGQYYYEGI